jgi:hypothetical protein
MGVCDDIAVDLTPITFNVALTTSPCFDVDIVQAGVTMSATSLAGQGPPGPKGDKGDQGDPGSQGNQGPPGPQGLAGIAATIAVGATVTGAPGSAATVTNSGSSSAAVFNFSVPAGVQGTQGGPGPTGNAATVAVGTTTTGSPGTNAAVNNSGSSSAAVFNFTIPAGVQGVQGPVGPQGPSGSGTGDMLKSVYDTNSDNIVDHAALADAAPWTGITGKPASFTPSAHAPNHITGGSDIIPAPTTSASGLVPALLNDTTRFFRSDGVYAVPAGGASGTTILTGTVPPTSNDGNAGDYYVDTNLATLWGPKAADAFGTSETARGTSVPTAFTTGTYECGSLFTFNVSGRITALRHYRAGGDTLTTRPITLWTAAGASVEVVNTSGETTTGAWVQVSLTTPVSVTAGQQFIVSRPVGGNLAYESAPGGSAHITIVEGRYGGTPPTTSNAGFSYLVDVAFQPLLGNLWPVALPQALPLTGGTLTGPVKGVAPVAATDLTTKQYVDGKAPASHAPSHITGGADIIPVVTSSATGLVPTLPADTTKFLRGDGTFARTAVSTDSGNIATLGSDNLILARPSAGFVSKTGAYTLTSADSNKYILCSGGSWTLTLPVAVLGLSFYVRNDQNCFGTTGTITVARSGAATIDGQTSLALLPCQDCLIVSDGTNWRTFGLKREVILGTQDITSSTANATVLLPAGFRFFELTWTSYQPVTNQDVLRGNISIDGGTTWLSGNHINGAIYSNAATTVAYINTATDTYIKLSYQASTTGQTHLKFYPGGGGRFPTWICDSEGYNTTLSIAGQWRAAGLYNSDPGGTVNALRYFAASSNIANSFLTVKGAA